MAIEATTENLLRLQTQLSVIRAAEMDLTWRIRQRQLVEREKLQRSAIDRAHRIRDQLLTAPARYAALLAADAGVDPAALNAALTGFVRQTLQWIADGPG